MFTRNVQCPCLLFFFRWHPLLGITGEIHGTGVLGLARTGLIFTGIQEGGTAGRADPTWPNRAGYSIPCAVMLGSGGEELGRANSLAAREGSAVVRSGRMALWVVRFVSCFLLICIVVVTVPFCLLFC